MGIVEHARVANNRLYITWRNPDGNCREKPYCNLPGFTSNGNYVDIEEIVGLDEEELYWYMHSRT